MPHKQRYAQPKRVMPAPIPCITIARPRGPTPNALFPNPKQNARRFLCANSQAGRGNLCNVSTRRRGSGPSAPVEIKQAAGAAAASVLQENKSRQPPPPAPTRPSPGPQKPGQSPGSLAPPHQLTPEGKGAAGHPSTTTLLILVSLARGGEGSAD